jgi:hypothetical protein
MCSNDIRCNNYLARRISRGYTANLTPARFEQLPESLQTFGTEMSQESTVHIANGMVKPGEKVQAFRSDSRQDDSSILVVTTAGDQFALLHAVKQACYVRIALDHAVADFAAR